MTKINDYCAEKLCGGFPVLTQEQLDACNDLFPAYVFFRRDRQTGTHIWTSCCHQTDYVLEEQRTVSGDLLCFGDTVRHNERLCCPFCGKKVQAKDLAKAGRRKTLRDYRAVVFLNAEENTPLYAQAYVAYKNYADLFDLSACPTYRFEAAYRFEPGKSLMVVQNYWSEAFEETENQRFREPFRVGYIGGWQYPPYHLIGADAIGRSCMRYSQYDAFKSREGGTLHQALMRYLSVYCLYPQVEMLVKLGLRSIVSDLIYTGKKNAAAIDWSQPDPRKAFGLTGAELKYWLGRESRNVDDIALYKRLRRHGQKVTFQELVELDMGREDKKRLVRLCISRNVKFRQAVRYLMKFTGRRCHGGYFGLSQAFEFWQDYLDMADRLHYDLTQEVVLYPRDLFEAHDTAAEQKRLNQANLSSEDFHKLTEKLDMRYSFQLAGYHIRPPMSTQEIIDEGQQLRHCVGGYAQRHAEGKVVILFLRSDERPWTPLVTIEMNGSRLVQIHGYRNERDGADDPRKVYADIVEPWLNWVQAGSKRDQDGKPILPKKRKEKTA